MTEAELIENWCRYPKNDGNKAAMASDLSALIEQKCREQREADNKIFENSMEVRLSILVKAALMEVNETPLVTNN